MTMWADLNGDLPPTVFDIGLYFELESKWPNAIGECEDENVQDLLEEEEFEKHTISFWKTVKNIKDTRRSAFEKKTVIELTPPRILATRLGKKMIATAPCSTPSEVIVPRGLNMKDAFPNKKRKDIEGEITQAESYLLSVALMAKEYSKHKIHVRTRFRRIRALL